MTAKADLEHRADELDDEALLIRWDHPTDYRTLRRIAADLRAIAATLNPEPTEETA